MLAKFYLNERYFEFEFRTALLTGGSFMFICTLGRMELLGKVTFINRTAFSHCILLTLREINSFRVILILAIACGSARLIQLK